MIRTLIFVQLFCFLPAFSAITISGDSAAAAGQTFSFDIQAHVASNTGMLFLVGAAQNGAKEFAISTLSLDKTQFLPALLEKAKVNNVADQTNPLFDKGIFDIALMTRSGSGQVSISVTNDEIKKVNLLLRRDLVLTTNDLNDAAGNITDGITAIVGANQTAFASVRAQGQAQFGIGDSGIALIADYIPATVEGEQAPANNNEVFAQLDFNNEANQLRAAPLNVSSDFIKITSDLAGAQVIDMLYSDGLKRVYIILQAQAGAGATDGVRALAMGYIFENKLKLVQVVPASVFDGAQDKIIGALGANAEVSLNKIGFMLSSTSLPYLIVAGGNGAPSATQQTVFALPLVDFRDANLTVAQDKLDEQGTIASKDAPVVGSFGEQFPHVFRGNQFQVPATTPAQMPTSADAATQVGGGPLAAGPIEEIIVAADTVFAAVGQPLMNEKPGIFYSQALFDADGKIAAWTNWARVGGTTQQIFGIVYDSSFADLLYMTGPDSATIKTVKKSQWGLGDEQLSHNLVEKINAQYLPPTGGLFGYFDFSTTTAGLSDLSLQIATGLSKVSLIQTGVVQLGVLCPTQATFSELLFEDGTIDATFPVGSTKIVTITGGVLDQLGPIDAAAIAQSGTDGYLFVGGRNGLAVLIQDNGDGWDTGVGELGPGFLGLVSGMKFAQIGDYRYIKKLIAQNGFLYVLTNNKLDRIAIGASDFVTNTLSVTTIAQLNTFSGLGDGGSFQDLAISEKLALLATSGGTFRVANGLNIQLILGSEEQNWQPIAIPEGQLPSLQLFPISQTGNPLAFSANVIGQLYLLGSFVSSQQGTLNRYAIGNTAGANEITDQSVVPFQDFSIENVLSNYQLIDDYRNLFATDGAAQLNCQDGVGGNCAKLFNRFRTLKREIPLQIEPSCSIVQILRSSASGSWFVAGDFGLRVNE